MADRNDHGGRPRVTLKHVAEACGLGVTTVSDILNGREGERTRYSRPTQEKVHRVVAELGYIVDRAAQQLRRGRSGTIGLLLTRHLHDASFAHTLHLAEAELRQRGYNLLLAVGDGPVVGDRLEHLRRERVEGIIFGPAFSADEVTPLDVMDVPAVVFGGWCGGRYDESYVDQPAALRLALQHLRGLGHERIGSFDRSTGRAAGDGDPGWWHPVSDGCDSAETFGVAGTFADRWTTADPTERPTALVCHDDHTAAVVLSALWQAGVRVPGDLSVVACGNSNSAAYLVPPLTAVDLHPKKQMVAAIDLLLHRFDHPDEPAATTQIDVELLTRASTQVLRATA